MIFEEVIWSIEKDELHLSCLTLYVGYDRNSYSEKKWHLGGNKTDSEVKNMSPERAAKLNSTKNCNLFEIHLQFKFELPLCFKNLFSEKEKFTYSDIQCASEYLKTVDILDMANTTWWI